MSKKRKSNSNKLQLVSIICSTLTALIAVGGSIYVGFISKETVVHYEYKEVPKWDIENTTDYIPLKVGNTWLYTGEFEYQTGGVDSVVKIPVELEVKVEKKIDLDQDTKLFILSNYVTNARPLLVDIILTSKDKAKLEGKVQKLKDSKVGILVIASKVFLLDSEQTQKIIDLENHERDSLPLAGTYYNDFFTYRDQHLEAPLFVGQRFGEIEYIIRDDLRYFWYVNSMHEYSAPENNKIKTFPVYEIVHLTGPDFSKLYFEPYIGITKYSFEHRGTVDGINLELIKYNLND
ncbi:hypothetical protein [Ornithinibacillus californiensis]|uniref:hypothetical protein n=1 Tax=Ornithinibacillus californiensis TaxID=161536 RepID=UPI00064DD8D1|nr:hypothetical protein [Ornithinibacillus californiensis]